jgi:hypothetical protein
MEERTKKERKSAGKTGLEPFGVLRSMVCLRRSKYRFFEHSNDQTIE